MSTHLQAGSRSVQSLLFTVFYDTCFACTRLVALLCGLFEANLVLWDTPSSTYDVCSAHFCHLNHFCHSSPVLSIHINRFCQPHHFCQLLSPPPHPPSAASVHSMHIHTFNKPEEPRNQPEEPRNQPEETRNQPEEPQNQPEE